jgi:hypothetical protein
MMSEFEYLLRLWLITVLPHPNAPGIAVVPPCTHLSTLPSALLSHAALSLSLSYGERWNKWWWWWWWE